MGDDGLGGEGKLGGDDDDDVRDKLMMVGRKSWLWWG